MKKGTKVVIGIIIAVPAIIVVTAVFIGRQYLRGARYNLTPEEAEESVYWALESGAGLIDTASAYYKDVICCEL